MIYKSIENYIKNNMDLINKEDWSELQYDMEVRREFFNAEICDFWTSIQNAGIKVPYYSVAIGYAEYLPFTNAILDSDEIAEIRKYCPSINISEIKDQRQLYEQLLKNFKLQLDTELLRKYLDKIDSGDRVNLKLKKCKIAITANPYTKTKLDISIRYHFDGASYGHTAVIDSVGNNLFQAIPGLCIAMNEKLINDEMRIVAERLLK